MQPEKKTTLQEMTVTKKCVAFDRIREVIEKNSNRADTPFAHSQEKWNAHIVDGVELPFLDNEVDEGVEGYASSNVDEAFALGYEAGEVSLARELVAIMNKVEAYHE